MNCSEVHKDLIFYLEGSLDDDKRNALEAHLKTCDRCSGFADMMRGSLIIIEQERNIAEDRGFADRVLASIHSGKKAVSIPLFSIFRYAAVAAVIIFGVFTGMNIAKIASGPGEYRTGELSDEEYYINDMYQEPIESFFLLKYEDNE